MDVQGSDHVPKPPVKQAPACEPRTRGLAHQRATQSQRGDAPGGGTESFTSWIQLDVLAIENDHF
jgi:hypothetical protein